MRHAINGARPGQSYWTEAGWVHTHAVDGGARLSDGQRAALEASGYELVKVGDEPEEERIEPNAEAQAAIKANRAAAAEAEAEARIPSKSDLTRTGRGKAKQ